MAMLAVTHGMLSVTSSKYTNNLLEWQCRRFAVILRSVIVPRHDVQMFSLVLLISL